jgi:predicted transcriptional regulator
MTTICTPFDHHILVGWWKQRGWVTMPVVVHIGDKLKETRTRELLTEQELAEKSGVGVNTIIRIERKQVEPHFCTIRKLAEALGIDPKALL